ncbi:MAG: C/D box methylation guide ribonucleoprotein complex aNOP56 subunit [Candidatus Bathyarchaeota archaeon]|uniref:C/D box methylation guide ribonucleoprotein complex aNOP56 subunit n=1 Tax=Candidatus Bathycorpusculum sp. TaxID=2994959 RepID=UPI00281D6F03|nr:C/D box methylation guide ribonucleoprotein complex aNOP56 subunit [Candidatus Termiticorpusculum sp.]
MKAFVIHYPFGVAAFDEKDSLIEKVLFSKKPPVAAKCLLKIESGKASDEFFSLVSLIGNVTLGVEDVVFVFENASIADEVQKKVGVRAVLVSPVEAERLRGKMSEVALLAGFVEDEQELALWNRNVSMELAKLRIKGASEKRDLIVGQAIQTLDDLDRMVNLFMARLREWYGIYFPEMDRLIEKHETYARLVLKLGERDNYTFDTVVAEGLPKERSELVAKTAQSSMGADISEGDLQQIQSLSRDVLNLYELRKNMESYVDYTMEELAPNVKAVAGALLGARLIAMAGGLQNLAMRPASTIQVLGAEKALFRSLKTGARPPKHGLIFQHTLLHDAKRWQRGKIARVIAGKLSIAARADAFGGNFVGDRLKAEVNKRLEEIYEKYKDAPPPKEPKPREERYDSGGGGGGRDREQRFNRDRRDRFGGGGGGRSRDRFGGGGGGRSRDRFGGGGGGRRDRFRGGSSGGGGSGERGSERKGNENSSDSGNGGSGKFREGGGSSGGGKFREGGGSSGGGKFREGGGSGSGSGGSSGGGKFREGGGSSGGGKFRDGGGSGSGGRRQWQWW